MYCTMCGGIVMADAKPIPNDKYDRFNVIYSCIDCDAPYEGNISIGFESLYERGTTGSDSGPFGKQKENYE